MKAVLIAAALAIFAGAAPAAEVASSADGSFTSQTVVMPVTAAFAFRGKSVMDKTDVIVVAISNGDIPADWMGAYVDRRRAIERRIKDNETVVVYVEFKPDGAYRGMSYYFKKGNGCGYCRDAVTSTVKVAAGRIAGKLNGKDATRNYTLTFNVPVTPDDHGAPLPPDGGAPGKAYLAYHEALVKRDFKALRPVLAKEGRDFMVEAEKKGKLAKEMDLLAKDHPTKSVRITQGFSKGNNAVLLIAGESSVLKLTGEVVLVNEGGVWRVEDELTDVDLQ